MHLWSVFVDLDESRSSGFAAAEAITYQELAAYVQMTGDFLSPWEVRAIRLLDRARRGTAKGA